MAFELYGPEKSSDDWAKNSNGFVQTPHMSNTTLNNVLENIGNTPLIRLNKLAADAGLECTLLAKCEFFNAGGSVKDRIAKRMIEEAEASGRLKPGDCIIEPTSGNTGIGLALASAVKGYRCIIVLPEKMSDEKVNVLKALGAEIIRTPTEAASSAPDSHISVARRLNEEIPNSHILNQYINYGNPLAHYDGTGSEILKQVEGGKVDMLVAGTGTGGTISGIAKKLKEANPNMEVVGVDPHGSILAQPASLNASEEGYEVEGIGYDFIPDVLDRSLVTKWVKSKDHDSFIAMRRAIRYEGLLCGGSCGAALSTALVEAKRLKKGQICVVVLPDSVRNYMTKALSNDWMLDRGFVDNDVIKPKSFETWWSKMPIGSIKMTTPLTVHKSVTCKDVVSVLKKEGFDMVPVMDDTQNVCGVVTEGNLTAKLLSGRVASDSPVTEAMYKKFRKVSMDDSLATLATIFDHEPFALVCNENRLHGSAGVTTTTVVVGIVTRIDLLDLITNGQP